MKKQNIKLKQAEQKAEIISLIRENLVRGDIKELADRHNKRTQDLYNVIKGNSWRKDLVKLLYDKAIENKEGLSSMIDSLKAVSTEKKP